MISYDLLHQNLQGLSVPKPDTGSLSGHQVGEPFANAVYTILKRLDPENVFRQYEYLNDLYSKNPQVIGFERRKALFNSPTAMFLLTRGKTSTDNWSVGNMFEDKQNDTADVLFVQDNQYEILDIKTRNIAKSSQPPNIISAFKLAQLCAKMIDNQEFDNISITYLEIDWLVTGNLLVSQKTHHAYLFRCIPTELYINWAASLQIQFHVSDLNQDFNYGQAQWAHSYIQHFVTQARKRANDMINKFVKPFEKYL